MSNQFIKLNTRLPYCTYRGLDQECISTLRTIYALTKMAGTYRCIVCNPQSSASFRTASLCGLVHGERDWLNANGFFRVVLCMDGKLKGIGGNAAMYYAAYHGELAVCKWLLEHGAEQSIRSKNGNGATPMMIACERGHLEVAMWLKLEGAEEDVRTKDMKNESPMYTACKYGHLEVAQWLYTAGAAKDITIETKFGFTPMTGSCRNGHLDVMKWLHEKPGHQGLSVVLEMAVSLDEPLDVLKWLGGLGLNVQRQDELGRTPMFLACCFSNSLKSMTWLYDNGAAGDIKTRSRKTGTPLFALSLQASGGPAQSTQYAKILWLVLRGAANDEGGHVCNYNLQHDLPHRHETQTNFCTKLGAVLNDHSAFLRFVLLPQRLWWRLERKHSLELDKKTLDHKPDAGASFASAVVSDIDFFLITFRF